MCIRQGHKEQRLIVQHLLEMRKPPDGIGGVAVQPSPNVIVDAPTHHGGEGRIHHIEGRFVAGGRAVRAQKEKRMRSGKLRRPSEPAVRGVELSAQGRDAVVENSRLGSALL